MSRTRAGVTYVCLSALMTAGITLLLFLVFPTFFFGLRMAAVVVGSSVGWGVMLLTFMVLLLTVDKGQNTFLGGYTAGFLVRLAALGITALMANAQGWYPLPFVLVPLAGSYFVLFLIEAWVLSRLGFATGHPVGSDTRTLDE